MFSKNKAIQRSVIVISSSEDRLRVISEHLNVRGFYVDSLAKNLNDIVPSDLNKNPEAIIIDLQMIKEPAPYIEFICKLLPNGIPCIVFCDNDSIKIRQEFLDKGLSYLHYETQFNELYSELNSQNTNQNTSRSINISVLGTKGGVGASFISYHLAKIIQKRYKNRVLLVQGVNSSFNIDLFENKNFNSEKYIQSDLSFYRQGEDDAYSFDKFNNDKFNFVFYDHSIQSIDRDKIEHILNFSDCVVLVANQELASIRKAKEVLDCNEFLLSVNQGCKKHLIALNENSLVKTLNLVEIEQILKGKVNIKIPFGASGEISNTPKGKTGRALDELASLIVGQHNTRRTLKSLFKRSL